MKFALSCYYTHTGLPLTYWVNYPLIIIVNTTAICKHHHWALRPERKDVLLFNVCHLKQVHYVWVNICILFVANIID